MKGFPELIRFLKNGEALFYQGVTLEWKPFEQPTITIRRLFHGQNESAIEIINLRDMAKEGAKVQDFHNLMIQKGFEMKSEDELAKDRKERERIMKEHQEKRRELEAIKQKEVQEKIRKDKELGIDGGSILKRHLEKQQQQKKEKQQQQQQQLQQQQQQQQQDSTELKSVLKEHQQQQHQQQTQHATDNGHDEL